MRSMRMVAPRCVDSVIDTPDFEHARQEAASVGNGPKSPPTCHAERLMPGLIHVAPCRARSATGHFARRTANRPGTHVRSISKLYTSIRTSYSDIGADSLSEIQRAIERIARIRAEVPAAILGRTASPLIVCARIHRHPRKWPRFTTSFCSRASSSFSGKPRASQHRAASFGGSRPRMKS